MSADWFLFRHEEKAENINIEAIILFSLNYKMMNPSLKL